jgi:uncharacterized protein
MNKYFVDTGAYFARFYKRDNYHETCLKIWKQVEDKRILTITTNHVLDELATLLSRRASYNFAQEKLRQIYISTTQIERPDEADEMRALNFFKKYADQKVSFTDCLSFVVMQKLDINEAFTFDRHFEYAGFKII